jgi:hypothetical protein
MDQETFLDKTGMYVDKGERQNLLIGKASMHGQLASRPEIAFVQLSLT